MKVITVALTALLFSVSPANADDSFKTWCDTYTAQDLISLTANRIYGRSSTLDDAAYKARSAWVNSAYKQSEKHYKDLTGHDFDLSGKAGWIAQCQTKNQSFCR